MEEILKLVGRQQSLFQQDLLEYGSFLKDAISGAKVLVIGGAGSIGQNVVKEIFKRDPSTLDVVDISENSLVELVRDIRSSLGYIKGDTEFVPICMGSKEFELFWSEHAPYDYVFNLAALKHVRSEKDKYSLMRMIKTNVLFTDKTYQMAARNASKKYFAVSTDKAANPANLMGATKRIMELSLASQKQDTAISTARFANVAFSDGSLLHGFNARILKKQPFSAPSDIKRYFMTGEEAGLLCLFSAVIGKDQEIYFPTLNPEENLISFSQIAERYLEARGYEPVLVSSEDEARAKVNELVLQKKWPCYFFKSETSGEKPFEEFYLSTDNINWNRHKDLGIISGIGGQNDLDIEKFLIEIKRMDESGRWSKERLVNLIKEYCPTLQHIETGKSLDEKM